MIYHDEQKEIMMRRICIRHLGEIINSRDQILLWILLLKNHNINSHTAQNLTASLIAALY